MDGDASLHRIRVDMPFQADPRQPDLVVDRRWSILSEPDSCVKPMRLPCCYFAQVGIRFVHCPQGAEPLWVAFGGIAGKSGLHRGRRDHPDSSDSQESPGLPAFRVGRMTGRRVGGFPTGRTSQGAGPGREAEINPRPARRFDRLIAIPGRAGRRRAGAIRPSCREGPRCRSRCAASVQVGNRR